MFTMYTRYVFVFIISLSFTHTHPMQPQTASSSIKHLAVIPDGNRRWAKGNKVKTALGYHQGLDAVKATIQACLDKGIQHLSFYTFSLENMHRSEAEQQTLFAMISNHFTKMIPKLVEAGVSVKFIGDRSLFPTKLMPQIKQIEEATKEQTSLHVYLLFYYGGQQDIVQACQQVAVRARNKTIKPNEITIETIKTALWTAIAPDPDLIVRTSGVKRLSNYFTFPAAYTEFLFSETLWPDVTKEMVVSWIDDFEKIQRNFGK